MVEGDSPWDYVNWGKAKKSFAKRLVEHDLVKLINADLESEKYQWQTTLGDGSDTDVYTGRIETTRLYKITENNRSVGPNQFIVGVIQKGFVEIPYQSRVRVAMSEAEKPKIWIPEQIQEAARLSRLLESWEVPYEEIPSRKKVISALEGEAQKKIEQLALLIDKSKELPYLGRPLPRRMPTLELLQKQHVERIAQIIEAKMAIYNE